MIDDSHPWIFNNAGGVMLEMKLLHASNNEYVMIWGTPIGSEGHTGRHLVEFYETVRARRSLVLPGRAVYPRCLYPRRPHLCGQRRERGHALSRSRLDGGIRAGILPSLLPFAGRWFNQHDGFQNRRADAGDLPLTAVAAPFHSSKSNDRRAGRDGAAVPDVRRRAGPPQAWLAEINGGKAQAR